MVNAMLLIYFVFLSLIVKEMMTVSKNNLATTIILK